LLDIAKTDLSLVAAASELPASRRWYAVHTRSNFELAVSSELAAKGVECYLPAVEEIHHWKDRKKLVEVPLFRSYVFVRIADADANRLIVQRTWGVARILGNAGEIEPVPDAEIESVRLLLTGRAPVVGHPFLREGDWVRVKHGALTGLEGILIRIKNQFRLVVSVNLLCQSVATEIDASDVQIVRRGAAGGLQDASRMPRFAR
jgi:transcription antitermination factor NusG